MRLSPLLRRACWSCGGGAVLGALISVVVNHALIEISLSPFFSVLFGLVLLLLGSLMTWRKLSEPSEPSLSRLLVLGFSTLVFLSGCACFLLEKHWFKRITPKVKVPMYMMLGISLCFAISFTTVDLLNLLSDRCGASSIPLITSSGQILIVLLGAVTMGAAFGLLFGFMEVEDDVS
ncbi:MAG: hypothetical protein SGPRY_008486, partial [Prymnesium sp.]